MVQGPSKRCGWPERGEEERTSTIALARASLFSRRHEFTPVCLPIRIPSLGVNSPTFAMSVFFFCRTRLRVFDSATSQFSVSRLHRVTLVDGSTPTRNISWIASTAESNSSSLLEWDRRTKARTMTSLSSVRVDLLSRARAAGLAASLICAACPKACGLISDHMVVSDG